MKKGYRAAAVVAVFIVATIWFSVPVTGQPVVVKPGESIQAAIDGLPSEGGTVQLAPGTHNLDATVRIESRQGITVVGAGMNETTITYGGRFFQVNSSDGIVLKDFALIGGLGIELYAGTRNSSVENVHLNAGGEFEKREGIGVGNAGDGPPADNNVTIQGNVLFGKAIGAFDYAMNILIKENSVDSFQGPQYSAIDTNRVSNITIVGNKVKNTIGPQNAVGVYCSREVVVRDNFLENNAAGIWIYDSAPEVAGNTVALSEGFALRIYQEYPVPDDSNRTVVRNNVIYGGAGNGILIEVAGDNIFPINAVIESNTIAANRGSGIHNIQSQHGTVKNNIIVSNAGYGIDGAGVISSFNDLWDNAAGARNGGSVGVGEIAADPLFADAAAGDFHVKSQAGRWDGAGWVLDSVTSPAIDAGDPASDFSREQEPNGGRINIGAYGNTKEASKSAAGPDFSLACDPSALTAEKGDSATSKCTVRSLVGFTGNVALSCEGVPAGVICVFDPAAPVLAAGGSATSELLVQVGGGTEEGGYRFEVAGAGATATRRFSIQLTVRGSEGDGGSDGEDEEGNRVDGEGQDERDPSTTDGDDGGEGKVSGGCGCSEAGAFGVGFAAISASVILVGFSPARRRRNRLARMGGDDR